MKNDLEARTLKFALDCLALVDRLPSSTSNRVVAGQFARSSTGVGALYREAYRAETRKDFIHKVGVSAKEASETVYWPSIIEHRTPCDAATVLLREARELLKIPVASGRTARRRS